MITYTFANKKKTPNEIKDFLQNSFSLKLIPDEEDITLANDSIYIMIGQSMTCLMLRESLNIKAIRDYFSN